GQVGHRDGVDIGIGTELGDIAEQPADEVTVLRADRLVTRSEMPQESVHPVGGLDQKRSVVVPFGHTEVQIITTHDGSPPAHHHSRRRAYAIPWEYPPLRGTAWAGQVQRPARTDSTASAAAPAVDVRRMLGPSRTALAPAARNAVSSPSDNPPSGPTTSS